MGCTSETLIDEDLAAFSQGAVSITVGACGRDLRPCQVRAAGCRISDDRRRITLFLAGSQASKVLECLHDGSAIAVVFNQPSTHRTFQLKGRRADIGRPVDADFERMAAYRTAFAREVAPLGFDELLVQTLFSFSADDIVTIAFDPDEVFSQTPGPNAGARLKGAQ